MSKRSLYVLIGCLVLVVLVMVLSVSNNVQNVTPTVTPNITPRVTAIPTATPVPTSTPITIKIVTPVPTQTPVLVEIVTPVPTETVTVTATPTPTQVPETPVPTETPVVTPEPTAIPTDEPTTVPTTTVIPTEVPTVVPTAIPTEVPTVAPTTPQITPIPEDVEKKYTAVEDELLKLTIMGGIYPDYSSMPSYDLYNYIDVSGLDQSRLFEIIRKPFEGGVTQWTEMKFSSGSAIDMLSFALNSSICENCGRIKISDAPTDSSQITAIFDEIERSGDQEAANRILLDYLYKYTRQNPNNPTERLIISCNDN